MSNKIGMSQEMIESELRVCAMALEHIETIRTKTNQALDILSNNQEFSGNYVSSMNLLVEHLHEAMLKDMKTITKDVEKHFKKIKQVYK
jgi:hypothetical protein